MSKHFRFGRKRIRNIEDVKLNPTGWGDVGIGGAVIIIPLVAVLVAMMTIPRFYYLSPDVIMGLLAAGLIGWVALILAYYGQVKSEGASLIWHDREFGFDERHHPRYEIKCAPQDIRLLYSPEDEIKNQEILKKRIDDLKLEDPELKTKIKKLFEEKPTMKMYYFRHHKTTQQCLGIDLEHSQVHEFHSHICFQPLTYNEQYVHSEGQENWHKGMLFNHPHAEQDGVKVLGWTKDFTTNEPMPICLLQYNSIQYKTKDIELKDKTEQFDIIKGLTILNAKEHGIILEQQNEIDLLNAGESEQLDKIDKKLKWVDKRAQFKIKQWKNSMAWPGGWWSSLGLGGKIVTIVMMICIVIIVIFVLNWLGAVKFW